MTIDTDLKDRLQALAFDVTDSFCYGCYKVVVGDSCPGCSSDDFANDDQFIEVDGEYYGVSDIENMVDELAD